MRLRLDKFLCVPALGVVVQRHALEPAVLVDVHLLRRVVDVRVGAAKGGLQAYGLGRRGRRARGRSGCLGDRSGGGDRALVDGENEAWALAAGRVCSDGQLCDVEEKRWIGWRIGELCNATRSGRSLRVRWRSHSRVPRLLCDAQLESPDTPKFSAQSAQEGGELGENRRLAAQCLDRILSMCDP